MEVLLRPKREPAALDSGDHAGLVRQHDYLCRLQHTDAERVAMQGLISCCDDAAALPEAVASGAVCAGVLPTVQALDRDGYFPAGRWKITIEGDLHEIWHRLFWLSCCGVKAAACPRSHIWKSLGCSEQPYGRRNPGRGPSCWA